MALDGLHEEAKETISELGAAIIDLKLKQLREPEFLLLQLPPEIQTTITPKIRKFNFDLINYFDPAKLLTLNNEVLEDISSWTREIKSYFRYALVNKPREIINVFSEAYKLGDANVAIQYILGHLDIFYIETAVLLALDEDLNREYQDKIRELLEAGSKLLKEKMDVIKWLLDTEIGKIDEIKKVVGYYSYRTLYFLSPRIYSPQVKEKLEKIKEGADLYKLADELSKINEGIFGKPVEKKDISDLFT